MPKASFALVLFLVGSLWAQAAPAPAVQRVQRLDTLIERLDAARDAAVLASELADDDGKQALTDTVALLEQQAAAARAQRDKAAEGISIEDLDPFLATRRRIEEAAKLHSSKQAETELVAIEQKLRDGAAPGARRALSIARYRLAELWRSEAAVRRNVGKTREAEDLMLKACRKLGEVVDGDDCGDDDGLRMRPAALCRIVQHRAALNMAYADLAARQPAAARTHLDKAKVHRDAAVEAYGILLRVYESEQVLVSEARDWHNRMR